MSPFILQDRPVATEKVLNLLTELANILCPAHTHDLSIFDPIRGMPEGYSVRVDCGEERRIVWDVQMWANGEFRRLRCAENLSIHRQFPGMSSWDILRTLRVWDGIICDDLIEASRAGTLKSDWTESQIPYGVKHRELIDFYGLENTNEDLENEIRAMDRGYRGPEFPTAVTQRRQIRISTPSIIVTVADEDHGCCEHDQFGDEGGVDEFDRFDSEAEGSDDGGKMGGFKDDTETPSETSSEYEEED